MKVIIPKASAVLMMMTLSLLGCTSVDEAEAPDTVGITDCPGLWEVARGDVRSIAPYRRDLNLAPSGAAIDAIAWDCNSEMVTRDYPALKARKIRGLPARLALLVINSSRYPNSLLVSTRWEDAGKPYPPRLQRLLSERS